MFIQKIPFYNPRAAFQLFAEDSHATLLDGSTAPDGSGVTTIAINPKHIVTATRKGVFVQGIQDAEDDPFAVIERIWKQHRKSHENNSIVVPFTGGVVGAFGYELGNYLERLPEQKADLIDLPLLSLGVYETVIAFDHGSHQAWIISHAADAAEVAKRLARRLKNVRHVDMDIDWRITATWQAEQSRSEIEDKIQRVIDYIHAGDIFQANYTQRFMADRPSCLSDYEIYLRLCALSPAPFSSFMRCGDVSLASASPERFIKLSAKGVLQTQPIKGTRRRDNDPRRDAELADELRRSAKDNAENLMIVDLMRNDLGRVAEIGSVHVPSLNKLETFSSVHHLVSTVEAQLRYGLNPIDVLRAIFPGGSISGAPKIRAMEIIRELEPAPRGFYCGCMGWIGFDGAMDMSMTIRTLTMTRDTIVAQAGGGIVADSNPSAEYEESMIKIAPLLLALTAEGMTNEEENDCQFERQIGG